MDLFDIVVSRKLSGGSSGGGGGTALIVERTGRPATVEECPNGGFVIVYSHSWQEIYDALSNGIPAYLKYATEIIDSSDSEVALLPIISASYSEELGYSILTAADTYSEDHSIEFDNATSKITLRCGHTGH